MDLVEAQWLARDMMEEHGLLDVGWGFEFDRATSRLGATHFRKELITLSKHMVAVADEETVRQIMLHEIAHAKLPISAKHGPEWKALAKSIGYTGKRTAENPYKHPSKKRRTSAVPSLSSSTRQTVTIQTSLRLKANLTGVVFKKARTRWHVKASDGRVYTVPFALAETLVI